MNIELAPGVPNTGPRYRGNNSEASVAGRTVLERTGGARRDFSKITVEGNLSIPAGLAPADLAPAAQEPDQQPDEEETQEPAAPAPESPPVTRKKKKKPVLAAPEPVPTRGGGGGAPWSLIASALVLITIFSFGAYVRFTQSATSSSYSSSSFRAYPLWLEPHDTTSIDVPDLREPHVRPLLASLEHSFRHYIGMGSQYECLCMHHLVVPGKLPNLKVCAVKGGSGIADPAPILLLVNPTMIGRGNKTDYYVEQSVSKKIANGGKYRYRTIFVQWTGLANGGDTLWIQLSDGAAACMQLALEEVS